MILYLFYSIHTDYRNIEMWLSRNIPIDECSHNSVNTNHPEVSTAVAEEAVKS